MKKSNVLSEKLPTRNVIMDLPIAMPRREMNCRAKELNKHCLHYNEYEQMAHFALFCFCIISFLLCFSPCN